MSTEEKQVDPLDEELKAIYREQDPAELLKLQTRLSFANGQTEQALNAVGFRGTPLMGMQMQLTALRAYMAMASHDPLFDLRMNVMQNVLLRETFAAVKEESTGPKLYMPGQ